MKWTIKNLEELPKVASEFISVVGNNRIFALRGAMGVGKTTFIKAVANVKNVIDEVNSPTFAIVNEYVTANDETIYHFDFYRIKKQEEALDMGCEEYFFSGNFCFIEWPEKIEDLLPEETIDCFFTELADGTRELEVNL